MDGGVVRCGPTSPCRPLTSPGEILPVDFRFLPPYRQSASYPAQSSMAFLSRAGIYNQAASDTPERVHHRGGRVGLLAVLRLSRGWVMTGSRNHLPSMSLLLVCRQTPSHQHLSSRDREPETSVYSDCTTWQTFFRAMLFHAMAERTNRMQAVFGRQGREWKWTVIMIIDGKLDVASRCRGTCLYNAG